MRGAPHPRRYGRAALLAALAVLPVTLGGAWAMFGFASPIAMVSPVLPDAIASAAIACALVALQRPNRRAVALAVAAPVALLLSSWAKLAVLGTPAALADLALLGDLLRVLPAWQQALLIALPAAWLLAFLGNLRLGRPSVLALVPAAALVAGAVAVEGHPPLANAIVWNVARWNSQYPLLGHYWQVVVQHARRAEWHHALRTLPREGSRWAPAGWSLPEGAARRNLHVIVLESFIDPLWFPAARWPADPLSPLFAAWRQAGEARALVPIFASRSSNTEFEVLCGLPAAVDSSELAFLLFPGEGAVPCLPGLLARQGYATASLVPSSAAFFGVGHAYRAMGFGQSTFGPDLDMSDRDGEWLSAAATLGAVAERAAQLRAAGGPVFSYVFVNAGHYPFERDRARRPDVLDPAPDHTLLRAWAHAAHYNAQAVEAFVATLRREDPDALIVILGDHNPPLGPNFSGYRAGGRLAAQDAVPPLANPTLYETPLLVLDRGAMVDAGRIAAWQVPALVLDRLTGGTFCATNACPHREAPGLRPLPDLVFAPGEAPRPEACNRRDPAPVPACAAALDATRRLERSFADALRLQGR